MYVYVRRCGCVYTQTHTCMPRFVSVLLQYCNDNILYVCDIFVRVRVRVCVACVNIYIAQMEHFPTKATVWEDYEFEKHFYEDLQKKYNSEYAAGQYLLKAVENFNPDTMSSLDCEVRRRVNQTVENITNAVNKALQTWKHGGKAYFKLVATAATDAASRSAKQGATPENICNSVKEAVKQIVKSEPEDVKTFQANMAYPPRR